jgi:hypothetical protein
MKKTRLVCCLAALLCIAAGPGHADSLVSSASSAGSAASDSLSDSVHASSNSSRRDDDKDRRLSEGEYEVVAVADIDAQRAGMLRLELQPIGGDGRRTIWLDLPRRAFAPRGIATGDVVAARARDYGFELARAGADRAREPFFLLLADDWYREFAPHVVTAQ